MKTEKVVISFIAVLIGILVAGTAFFLYQSTKVIPNSTSETIPEKISPKIVEPTAKMDIFLTIDSPKDEEVVENRTISIMGKTKPEAAILISTNLTDQVVTPAKNGDFSATVTLSTGANYIEILAIAQSGQEIKVIRTITVSSENF